MERAEREATEVEVETICPMKPLSLPYRERLCKITKACVHEGRTSCRIAPAEESK